MRGRGFTSLPSASLLLLPVGENLGMAGNEFPPLSFCLLPFAAFFFFFIPTSKESLTRVQTNGCSGVEWRNREATCLDSACNDHSSENDAMPFAIRENFVARLAGVRPADLPRSVTRSKNKFDNFEICCSFFVG